MAPLICTFGCGNGFRQLPKHALFVSFEMDPSFCVSLVVGFWIPGTMKPTKIYWGPTDISKGSIPPMPSSLKPVLHKMRFLSITKQLMISQPHWDLHAVKANSSSTRIHHFRRTVLKCYKTSKLIDLSPTKITWRGLPINNGIPLILELAEYFFPTSPLFFWVEPTREKACFHSQPHQYLNPGEQVTPRSCNQ